jgi:hypothetical protein
MATETTDEIRHAAETLAAFDARHGPRGLLQRYARGRIANFGRRQVLTATGAISLALLSAPWVGALAAGLALLGEAVDWLVLSHVLRRLDAGAPDAPLRRAAAIAAGLQALSIASCVVLAWVTATAGAATFFALAFLTGAAMNAGLVVAFHRGAALARLAVYAATPLVVFGHDVAVGKTAGLGYDLLGAAIMGYVVYVFIKYVSQGYARSADTNRDLLERQVALADYAAQLRAQQRETRKLALVARHANDSILIAGPDWRINWVNDAFIRQTGFTLDQARGRRPGELLHGPRTSADAIARIDLAVAEARAHREEIVNYSATGREMWVEVNMVPVIGPDGQVEMIVSVEREITAAKDHARELAKAKLAAEAAAQAKSDFLATMSHEIRTPMNGVIGMAELLCEAQLDTQSHVYAQTIRGSAEALLSILNDILDLSKLEAGKLDIVAQTFDPAACVEDVVRLFRPEATAKGLTLDFAPDPGVPPLAMGDAGRLRQILLNLIGNAVKFTADGTITVSVGCEDGPNGHVLRVAVADTGIGIAPQMLDQVFDRFTQAETTTTRSFGGSGLGLTISRMLARLMGGDIVASSVAGSGSVFTATVRLGRASAEAAAPDQPKVPAPSGVPPATSETEATTPLCVLVADDNAINRMLLEKVLETLQISALFAEDGQEAVEVTLARTPDVVFMDMSMPRLDGLDATRAIRAAPIAQPVIVALTANAFDADRDKCLAAGMDDFLSKPVRRPQLLEKLAAAAVARGRAIPQIVAPPPEDEPR